MTWGLGAVAIRGKERGHELLCCGRKAKKETYLHVYATGEIVCTDCAKSKGLAS